MIYDKNQFKFNIVMTVMLLALLGASAYLAYALGGMRQEMSRIDQGLSGIRDRQDFNYIQASHREISYLLTSEGFFIKAADDYGNFSGPSMQPAIFDGNVVIEERYVEGTRLSQGQIIRYIDGNSMPIIHRIRAVYPDKVYVQGDNLSEGEFVLNSRITHVIVGVLFT